MFRNNSLQALILTLSPQKVNKTNIGFCISFILCSTERESVSFVMRDVFQFNLHHKIKYLPLHPKSRILMYTLFSLSQLGALEYDKPVNQMFSMKKLNHAYRINSWVK